MKSTTIPERNKTLIISVPQIKVRKPYAPMERVMRNKRNYSRQNFKRGVYE